MSRRNDVEAVPGEEKREASQLNAKEGRLIFNIAGSPLELDLDTIASP